MAGALRLELKPRVLETPVTTFTLHPNIAALRSANRAYLHLLFFILLYHIIFIQSMEYCSYMMALYQQEY